MAMNTYMYLLTLVRLSSLVSITDGVVQSVTRRLTGDTYALTENNSNIMLCGENNTSTFLVSERRCIRNEELLNECRFAIAVMSRDPSSYRLLLGIDHDHPNDTETITATTFTSRNNLTKSDAVIVTKQTNQTISNHCQITSLEVYRGKKHSTVISHCGFSLSDMGKIEINHTRLRYISEEYLGEFYRMNLSCSDGGLGLPKSGCLFFKIGGTANITKSKFDSAIEGSLELRDSITTLPMTLPTYQMTSPSTTNSTTSHSDPTMTTTKVDNVSSFGSNTLVVVPLVGGMTILTFSIVMVCVAVWFKNRRKRKLNSISNQPQNQDAATSFIQPNMCQRNPAYIQLCPLDGSQADLLSGSYGENPAYNIDAQTSSHQEPAYEVIPLDTDGTPHPVQGTQNISYNQNPAYTCLGIHVHVGETLQADPTVPSDCSRNPAYGIHSNPN